MRKLLVPATTLLLSLGAALPAQGQAGVAFGRTTASGHFAHDFRAGWHIQGLLRLAPPASPVALRAEVAYDHLDRSPDAAISGNLQVASGLLDGTISLPVPLLHPYAIGGVGYYYRNAAGLGGSREGKVGFNGGVGVRLQLPVIAIFAEARLHSIPFTGAHLNLVPLTVGLLF